MNSKKMLIVTVAIFIFVVAIVIIVSKNITNKILYYDAKVEVMDTGELHVSETIVFDYKQYINYQYRDIPTYNSYKEHGKLDEEHLSVKVYQGNLIDSFDIVDITEKIKVGYSFNGDVTRYGERIECPCYDDYCPTPCESIYIDAGEHGKFEGVYSFNIDYYLSNMVTVYNDCAEINYRLFEYLGANADVASATVFLPFSSYNVDNFYAYGHGLYNGMVERVSNRQFNFISEDVASDEMLEFRIVFPKEVLTDKNISEENIRYYQRSEDKLEYLLKYEKLLQEKDDRIYSICVTTDTIVAIIIIAMVIITIIVYIKYDKELKPKFDGEYYRELPNNYPPAIMSYLYYFQKTNDEDFTATVLNLIRKKVVILDCLGDMNDKDCDYRLTVNESYNAEELLTPHEKVVYDWLIKTIGDEKTVTFDQIENFGKTYSEAKSVENFNRNFKNTIEIEANKYDFFIEKSSQKFFVSLPAYICFGIIAIIFVVMVLTLAPLGRDMFALAICAIIYLLYVTNIKKRSVNGNEEYHKWKAFKNFLEDFGSLKDYSVQGIEIWEEYLVYATSLKVADKVMDQLKVSLPEMNEMDVQTGTYLYYTSIDMRYRHSMFHRIHRTYSRTRSNSTNTIIEHNARNRSGGGRSGGFSGGSSFGGGGGGFRSGR